MIGKMKIAIFASGSGSNFQAIYDATENNVLSAEVGLLVCDRINAFVIDRAEKAGIPTFVFSAKDYESKEAYEKEILKQLEQNEIEFIVLAGYMRLVGETLLSAFERRIVNIHPSLLPAFPGKDAVGQAISAGVKVTGVTVHFVDEGMDTGPIIAQRACNLSCDETKPTLQSKIQVIEHELYPATLEKIFTEKFTSLR